VEAGVDDDRQAAGLLPPPDFLAFVAGTHADLRAACRDLTHNDAVADRMLREMLVLAAVHWRRISRKRRRWLRHADPTALDPGRVYLLTLFNWEAKSWQVDPDRKPARHLAKVPVPADALPADALVGVGAGGLPEAPPEEDDDGLIGGPARVSGLGNRRALLDRRPTRSREARLHDFGTAMWERSRATRQRRKTTATILACVLGFVILVSPRRQGNDFIISPPGPPPPTAAPSDVDILPSFEQLTGLSLRGINMPNIVSPTTTLLKTSPVHRAVLLILRPNSQLDVVGDDGRSRTIAIGSGILQPIPATTLSPDGKTAVLAAPDSNIVINLTTGAMRSIPVTGSGQATPVWRTNTSYFIPDERGARLVDLITNKVTPVAGLTGLDVVTMRDGAEKLPVELFPALSDSIGPKLRLWHQDPITHAAGTDPAVNEDRNIYAPHWLDSWFGPGFGNGSLVVRATVPTGLVLPTSLGVVRRAIGVIDVRGLAARTLTTVESGTQLMPLGWLDDQSVAFAAVKDDHAMLLSWNIQDGTIKRISDLGQGFGVSFGTP
jgi:hypothetical protein